MKRAILSDIHGNLEALEAVLSDLSDLGVEQIICLGDIVGYGPNPCECVDRAMEFEANILGNHDQGALFDPEGFSSGAAKAIFWTRDQLENGGEDEAERRARWQFLAELPRTIERDEELFVHGSARNPLNEYVFPEDIYNKQKLDRIFELVPKWCFQGHTHVPGVFSTSGRFSTPQQLDFRFDLPDEKVMVNVGSVGQPRDGIAEACYVVVDGPALQYRRVPYPVQTTAEKIYAIDGLDDFLGNRLLEGR